MKLQIDNIPDYNGVGIYAVFDELGKAYVGSSRHVRDRIISHTNNPIWADMETYNHKFTAKVLEQCNPDISDAELLYREGVWLATYGGKAFTYNQVNIPIHAPLNFVQDLSVYTRLDSDSKWWFGKSIIFKNN